MTAIATQYMSKKYAQRIKGILPIVEDALNPRFYHDGKTPEQKKADRHTKLWAKDFVVWDGEGGRAAGKHKPQNYILFGCYNGDSHEWISRKQLNTYECLEFIIEQGRANPNAWHVGFAFGYDVDMILRSLSVAQFKRLKERGYAKVGDKYRVEHIPGKWFRVTEYGSQYPVVRTDRFTVTIFDCWGFFQSSLVAALKSTIPDHPLMKHLPEIEAGKDARKQFTYEQLEYVTKYWKIENELFYYLINRLREMLYSVNLYITSWHGPGALASYAYQANGIGQHKSDCGADIYDAARYAYAGGRFERFHIGRYTRAYGYDINSAYPNAIAKLPSLTEGTWKHVKHPKRIVEFGVYHVRMLGPAIKRDPAPLFHRDSSGNISYPWRTEGWYWSPEVGAVIDCLPDFQNIEIIEGWEYTGWRSRPFAFVEEIYEQRRKLKAENNGSQMALKLLLNSLYGKMAQRAGWERTGEAPRWHQLEWAGWVTSFTRAMLYRLMHQIPYDKLIAVETDGIYTTATPDELGIEDSKQLGGWEVSYYDELIYLQSGVYAKKDGDDWSIKFRGLDRNSFGDTANVAAKAIGEHAKALFARPSADNPWPNLCGTTTRFVGYRNALFRQQQNRGDFTQHHCVWETEPREISCGSVGKRIHSPRICKACADGLDSYQQAHETIVKSKAMLAGADERMSYRHDIPWLDHKDKPKYWWRLMEDENDGLIHMD
jgi:hypothetical protein